MLKKLFILLIILAVIGLATIPMWTQKMAENAFNHPENPNSPRQIKEAMLVKIRIQRYEKARQLAEKAVIYFPESRELPDFIYNAAKCAEIEKKPYVAIFWYRMFLKKYPKHMWQKQAYNHLTKLKELYNVEDSREPAGKKSRKPSRTTL